MDIAIELPGVWAKPLHNGGLT